MNVFKTNLKPSSRFHFQHPDWSNNGFTSYCISGSYNEPWNTGPKPELLTYDQDVHSKRMCPVCVQHAYKNGFISIALAEEQENNAN